VVIAFIRSGAGRVSALLIVLLAVFGLAGCATQGNTALLIQQDLTQRQPDQALQRLRKLTVPNTDRVLYLLNEGMLLHLAGHWQESNGAFETAQRLMQQLSALSLREQGTSLLVNDSVRSYEGESYEKVMLHVYKALNYLALHQPFEARVEVLQLDQLLRSLSESPSGADPDLGFSRYLAGMIYENLGEWSDAMISYRKAYEDYERHGKKYDLAVPKSLQRDLVRMARMVGLKDELKKYQKEFDIGKEDGLPPGSPGSALGELVVVFNDGLAPLKKEHSVAVTDAKGHLIRISLPYLQRRPPLAAAARLTLGDTSKTTQRVENISAVAFADLDAQMPKITARTLARVIAKKKVEDKAGKDNPLAGALLNVAAVLTEVADTRSWTSLPDNIQLARLPLAPGRYSFQIEVLDSIGRTIGQQTLNDVQIDAEAKTFVSYYWSASSPVGGHR